jgi:hypothetical protein
VADPFKVAKAERLSWTASNKPGRSFHPVYQSRRDNQRSDQHSAKSGSRHCFSIPFLFATPNSWDIMHGLLFLFPPPPAAFLDNRMHQSELRSHDHCENVTIERESTRC